MKVYDYFIKEKLGDSMRMLEEKDQHKPRQWIPYKDYEKRYHKMPENYVCLDKFDISLTDSLINAEVLLHQGEADDGSLVKALVIRHLTDENGNLIGQVDKKINMNTLMYEVEFMD